MFCKNCGSKMSDDSVFCVTCGTKVEPQGNVIAPEAPRVTPVTPTEPIKLAETPVNNTAYQQPISTGNDELLSSLIGKNQDYYLKQFEKIDRGEKSFNWIAFFFSPVILLYRKQYSLFLKLILPVYLLLIVQSAFAGYVAASLNLTLTLVAVPVTYFITGVYTIVTAILCGKWFNKKYKVNLEELIEQKQLRSKGLSEPSSQSVIKKLKPSAVFPVVFLVGITVLMFVINLIVSSIAVNSLTNALSDEFDLSEDSTTDIDLESILDNSDEEAPESSEEASNISSNDYIQLVKDGSPNAHPDLYYGVAFEEFFTSPEWDYEKADNGDDVVIFTGGCTYMDVDVDAKLRFIVDFEGQGFTVDSVTFNDVPQSEDILTQLLAAVFGDESYESFYAGPPMADLLNLKISEAYNILMTSFDGEFEFLAYDGEETDGPRLTGYTLYIDGEPVLVYANYGGDSVEWITVLNPQMGLPINENIGSNTDLESLQLLADIQDLQLDVMEDEAGTVTNARLSYGANTYAIDFQFAPDGSVSEISLFTGRM